jgi:Cu2+-containing amine oxidase
MIEVLKQALEALKDVGVLTDREWQAVHKNKANELRQAIAELESQEPVCPECKAEVLYECVACSRNNYPPQRTWVGLTDKEAQWLYDNCRTPATLIDMVEAKLKEKNT